jgi:hypothetical protein
VQTLEYLFFALLMVNFTIGAVGCAITIPIVAVKFFSVLFEEDEVDQLHMEYAQTKGT